ncbi:MAG: SDR family oxidoreductase [Bacteriovoracaceae bacterium]|nr:SDR family oxidoreductase [Bacteriovoracaceae bacterium]
MKVLVIGGTGMIGHRLWASLSSIGHEVYSVSRSDFRSEMKDLSQLDWSKSFQGVNVENLGKLEDILSEIKPEITLNCVGIVKQHELSESAIPTISLNSLFPHQLNKLCVNVGSRMLQMSTDCVFSGEKGDYTETDIPDATDLYGRSKILGEVINHKNTITIRTSTIGREINPHGGLIEWLLSNKGKKIKGFSKAIYSGFPTHTFAKVLSDYVFPCPDLSGLYHLSTEPIDKFSLLQMAKEVLELDIEIEKEESISIKRDLDSTCFRDLTGMPLMSWNNIINDLKVDFDFYNSLKR